MKLIIHSPADDLIFAVRAVKTAIEAGRSEACYQYGDADDAPTVHARMNASGSWTAWVQRAGAVETVAE